MNMKQAIYWMILGGWLCFPAYAQRGLLTLRTNPLHQPTSGKQVEVCIDADENVKSPTSNPSGYLFFIDLPSGWMPVKDANHQTDQGFYAWPENAVGQGALQNEHHRTDLNRLAISFISTQVGTIPGTVACLLLETQGTSQDCLLTFTAEVNDRAVAPIRVLTRGAILSHESVRCDENPGDVTNDGTVNLEDIMLLRQFYLLRLIPTEKELLMADARPRPGKNGLPYGDGRILADDLNWVFRRALGLESVP
jgi:hypothetical protein